MPLYRAIEAPKGHQARYLSRLANVTVANDFSKPDSPLGFFFPLNEAGIIPVIRTSQGTKILSAHRAQWGLLLQFPDPAPAKSVPVSKPALGRELIT